MNTVLYENHYSPWGNQEGASGWESPQPRAGGCAWWTAPLLPTLLEAPEHPRAVTCGRGCGLERRSPLRPSRRKDRRKFLIGLEPIWVSETVPIIKVLRAGSWSPIAVRCALPEVGGQRERPSRSGPRLGGRQPRKLISMLNGVPRRGS